MNVATYAAMKSGLKAMYRTTARSSPLVATYAAMKSGLKVHIDELDRYIGIL